MRSTKKQMAIGSMTFRVAVFTAVALALLVCSGSAWAQSTDVFKVSYFDNNTAEGAPGAVIHVINPGAGALCADVYVWRADQELEECCSCQISVNGLLTFTVAAATANPGDGGGVPVSGSIDIIADSTPACTDAAAASPTPTPTLRAWATHVNVNTVGTPTENAFDVTETALLDSTLSSGEESEASGRCAAIQANDSGHGLCDAICGGAEPTVRRAK